MRQCNCEVVGQRPIRSIILGPAGSDKTVLVQKMNLDRYKGCLERIYILSPSIAVDSSWHPLIKYIGGALQAKHTDEEPTYFDHYDPLSFHEILDTQHNSTQFMKNRRENVMYSDTGYY